MTRQRAQINIKLSDQDIILVERFHDECSFLFNIKTYFRRLAQSQPSFFKGLSYSAFWLV